MNTKVTFHRGPQRGGTKPRARKHTLSKCQRTGLARYRDRHQARAGAKALSAGACDYEVDSFACSDCRAWHIEKVDVREPIAAPAPSVPAEHFTRSLGSRKRRYFLIDIENPTRGAKATCEEVSAFWDILKRQAPGVATHDHVVVGASRGVARRYRPAIHGDNVKWVIGANSADAADRALLAAIDLRRVARQYDELVIVSGDHIFADLARRAKQAGLSVQVVTAEHGLQLRPMLAQKLAAVADTHTRVRVRVPRMHPDNADASSRDDGPSAVSVRCFVPRVAVNSPEGVRLKQITARAIAGDAGGW